MGRPRSSGSSFHRSFRGAVCAGFLETREILHSDPSFQSVSMPSRGQASQQSCEGLVSAAIVTPPPHRFSHGNSIPRHSFSNSFGLAQRRRATFFVDSVFLSSSRRFVDSGGLAHRQKAALPVRVTGNSRENHILYYRGRAISSFLTGRLRAMTSRERVVAA